LTSIVVANSATIKFLRTISCRLTIIKNIWELKTGKITEELKFIKPAKNVKTRRKSHTPISYLTYGKLAISVEQSPLFI
jgi:hypothetical protein